MTIHEPPSGVTEPSAITSVIEKETPPDLTTELQYLYHLALQVRHNLQYEHGWSHLNIHLNSPITEEPLPRPLISGLPPKRLYIHPDEQVELLKAESERKKKAKQQRVLDTESKGVALEEDSYASPELEWVLPTHLREKWSLHRIAEVFDGISLVPPDLDAESKSKQTSDSSATHSAGFDSQPNKWRSTKRVLLATLSDDSTVVYYIVHDGLAKPRQN
jgi:tRNA-splicing endonuclease subunit Sen15